MVANIHMFRPFRSSVLVLSGVLLSYACSGESSKKAFRAEPDAGAAGEVSGGSGEAGAVSRAGGSSNGGGVSGGAPDGGSEAGLGGQSDGGVGGASDVGDVGGAGGADTEPLGCNATCVAGACVFEQCLGTTTLETLVNLSTTPISAERQCAEAPAFAVTALSVSGATLSASASGCLANDDEVLLINLQGSAASTANVGAWELLKVSVVAGDTVTFASNKQRNYGAASNSDADVGTGQSQQRVALIRVPRFGVLDVRALGTLTANPWDGQLGGVIALRAGKLQLAGKIDGSALGYRGGRFSQDDSNCSDSIVTDAGESIAGIGTLSTLANFGASGGIGAGNTLFNSNTPLLATPGHALPGEAGSNFGGRTANTPGGTYGSSNGSRLTLGSGPGGGLTCDNASVHDPVLTSPFGGKAGGIVLLLADEVSLTETGRISASPPPATRDIAFAGGYVLIRGQSLTLGTGQVSALGGIGKGVNGNTLNITKQAGSGYVTLDAPSITGSTTPAATLLQ